MSQMLDMRRPDDLLKGPLRPDAIRRLAKSLYHVRVSLKSPRGVKNKTINSISDKGANQLMFHNEQSGQMISVADYFKSTGRPLKYPALICINVGTKDNPCFVPPELVSVLEGQKRTKLDPKQTAEIIKQAAQKPEAKRAYINEVHAHIAPRSKEMLDCWGLTLGSGMTEVNARVLPPPKLQYGGQCVDPGPQGQWNLIRTKFFEARPLNYWAVASMMRREECESTNSLREFMAELMQMLNVTGLAIPPQSQWPPTVYSTGRESAQQCMEQAIFAAKQANGGKEPQIIFVLLSFKEVGVYKVRAPLSRLNPLLTTTLFLTGRQALLRHCRWHPQPVLLCPQGWHRGSELQQGEASVPR